MYRIYVVFLALTLVAAADPTKTDTIDYVFAGEALSKLGKKTDDGRKFKDGMLKMRLKPSTGVTALLLRVKLENGKVKDIEVFYSKGDEPKIAPVRDKPFSPSADAEDFTLLMKAVSRND